jgi:hypothetical protein
MSRLTGRETEPSQTSRAQMSSLMLAGLGEPARGGRS